MMSARLRFRSSKTMKDLARNTLAKGKFRVPYTKKTTKQKGFYFVKDEGIYVMNGYANKDKKIISWSMLWVTILTRMMTFGNVVGEP